MLYAALKRRSSTSVPGCVNDGVVAAAFGVRVDLRPFFIRNVRWCRTNGLQRQDLSGQSSADLATVTARLNSCPSPFVANFDVVVVRVFRDWGIAAAFALC